MRRFCRAIEVAIEAVAAAMVVAFATIILADVVCRYWLQVAIPWVSECTVLLFQCTAFLGSTLALRQGLHFGLGLVLTRAWPGLAVPIGLLVAGVVTVVSLLLLVLAIQMAEQAWDSIYATLQISHGWVYVTVAVSGGVMALFGLEQALSLLRSSARVEGAP